LSIKIYQALTEAILFGEFELDIVHGNEVWSYWNGSAYESKKGVYTPDAERPYLDATFFPSASSPLTLNCTDEDDGLFQIIVNYPVGSGVFTTMSKLEEIKNAFYVGSILTYDGQNINITLQRTTNGVPENGFYAINFRAEYRAFTTR